MIVLANRNWNYRNWKYIKLQNNEHDKIDYKTRDNGPDMNII